MLYTIKRKLDSDMRHGKAWHYPVRPIMHTENPYTWVDCTQLSYRHPVAFESEAKAKRVMSKIAHENYRYRIEPLNGRLSRLADIERT